MAKDVYDSFKRTVFQLGFQPLSSSVSRYFPDFYLIIQNFYVWFSVLLNLSNGKCLLLLRLMICIGKTSACPGRITFYQKCLLFYKMLKKNFIAKLEDTCR